MAAHVHCFSPGLKTRPTYAVGFAMLVMVSTFGCTGESPEPRGTLPPTEVAAPPADAEVTPSGLSYRVLARGPAGRHPGPNSRVVVNYTGWTTDGTVVEGDPVGDPPVTLELSETMPGWQEGLRLMAKGDKFRFWIPASLAHRGAPGKPAGMLVYDIYLVNFTD